MKIKVSVTESNIWNGKARNCQHCPIAMALRDFGFKMAHVGVMHATLTYAGKSFRLPEIACDFITKFDLYDFTEPFSFVMDI